MKKNIFALCLSILMLNSFVFANTENNKTKKIISNPFSAEQRNAAMEQWEATPSGIYYKKWKASAAGKKVFVAEAKIKKSIKEFANMDAIVTSLTLPPGSRLGFGMMVKIKGEDYILAFGPEKLGKQPNQVNNEFAQLHTLKVNDKIILRSRNVSHAPKYAYAIVAGDYIAKGGKVIYKRAPRTGGC